MQNNKEINADNHYGKSVEFVKKHGKMEYNLIHQWIRKKYGSAKGCEHCGNRSGLFDWALKKGCEYERKRENYLSLCKSCHRIYDGTVPVNRNPIYQCDKNGGVIKEYRSVQEAAREVKADASSVFAALNGRQKTCMGFFWRYKEGRKAKIDHLVKNSRYITYKGQTKTLSEWSVYIGGAPDLLSHRISGLGWSDKKAIETPIRTKSKQRNNGKY